MILLWWLTNIIITCSYISWLQDCFFLELRFCIHCNYTGCVLIIRWQDFGLSLLYSYFFSAIHMHTHTHMIAKNQVTSKMWIFLISKVVSIKIYYRGGLCKELYRYVPTRVLYFTVRFWNTLIESSVTNSLYRNRPILSFKQAFWLNNLCYHYCKIL